MKNIKLTDSEAMLVRDNLGDLRKEELKRENPDHATADWLAQIIFKVEKAIQEDCEEKGVTKNYYCNKKEKSKGIAILLAFFLGGLGAHKFYLRQSGWGLFYLVFCWTWIPSILGVLEAIVYATNKQENFDKQFNS